MERKDSSMDMGESERPANLPDEVYVYLTACMPYCCATAMLISQQLPGTNRRP